MRGTKRETGVYSAHGLINERQREQTSLIENHKSVGSMDVQHVLGAGTGIRADGHPGSMNVQMWLDPISTSSHIGATGVARESEREKGTEKRRE